LYSFVKLDTKGRFGSCSFHSSVAFLKGEDAEGLEDTGLAAVGV
jgi:hypothetical protein